MPIYLLFSAHITFTMTLHCIISLPGQSYSYKECTRQDISAAQQLQRAGESTAIPLLLPWAVSITDFYSVTLLIPFHVQSRTAAENKRGTKS